MEIDIENSNLLLNTLLGLHAKQEYIPAANVFIATQKLEHNAHSAGID